MPYVETKRTVCEVMQLREIDCDSDIKSMGNLKIKFIVKEPCVRSGLSLSSDKSALLVSTCLRGNMFSLRSSYYVMVLICYLPYLALWNLKWYLVRWSSFQDRKYPNIFLSCTKLSTDLVNNFHLLNHQCNYAKTDCSNIYFNTVQHLGNLIRQMLS